MSAQDLHSAFPFRRPTNYLQELFAVTGQFRCATLELCNFDAKQSILCCFDGLCTNLCCAKADVILMGPREQNRGLWVGYYLKTKKYKKYNM